MTVSVQDARVIYVGSGTTGPFAVAKNSQPIIFKDNSHIKVKKRTAAGVETTLVSGTHYTLTGGPTAGQVTLASNLELTEQLVIYREQPLAQEVNLATQDPFRSQNVVLQYDKIFLILQEMQDQINRSLKVSVHAGSGVSSTIPFPEANAILAWDADAEAIEHIQLAEIDATIATPVSSTDNAVVRWNGTSGLSFQNSAVTITDDGDMVLAGAGRYINFNNAFTGSDGYGIRSNAGIMQFRSEGASWRNMLHTSGDITITHGGTGAVSRTLGEKLGDFVTLRDFGADPTGVSNSATAFQNAVNYCVTNGYKLYTGPGTFRINSAVTATGHVAIEGDGWDNTTILVGTGTQDGIVFNSENGGSLTGMQIMGSTSSSQTAGALVRITGPAGGNINQIYFLRDLRLLWGFISVDFDAAQVWTIDNCYMLGNPLTGVGIVVDNTEFPGNGELCISNTMIQGGDAVTTWGGSGVLHRSGVNLKIVNSEIFGWVNGYNLTLNDATAMAGTFISNSVFSQVENAITLNKGTGTQYNIVTIIGNEIIARNPIATDANTGWLYDIVIVGNFIGVGQGDPVSASTGTGVSIQAANGFTVVGNVIQGASSNNSIIIGSNASNGYVASNALRGSLNDISNSSSTTSVLSSVGADFVISGNLRPLANDGGSIGTATFSWSDLFLASGGVINWNNGDVVLTHSSNAISLSGGSLNTTFTTANRFINNTDAASNLALQVESDRATPAANDTVAIGMYLSDSAGNQDEFVRLSAQGTTVTSTSEVGQFFISLAIAGTLTNRLLLTQSTLCPTTNDVLALGTTTLMWSDAFFASGAVVNFNNGDITLTHSSDVLSMNGGALQVFNPTSSIIRFVGTVDQQNTAAAYFESDRATPTANDTVYIGFRISDSGGTQTEMARILTQATVVTDTSEAANMQLSVMAAGTLTTQLVLANGLLRPNTNDQVALGSATISFADVFLASGAVINFNNGDVTITHSADTLTFAGAASGYAFDSTITTISTTASFTAFFGRLSEDGAGAGPFMTLDRLSASPAASDVLGTVVFNGRDSGGNITRYGEINVTIITPTDASEVGRMNFHTNQAGTSTAHMALERTATATHTALLIWDNDNGAVERVTVGAADSGGAGFKVLRIAN